MTQTWQRQARRRAVRAACASSAVFGGGPAGLWSTTFPRSAALSGTALATFLLFGQVAIHTHLPLAAESRVIWDAGVVG